MSDTGWGIALLLLGAWGSFVVVRDARKARRSMAGRVGAGAVNVVVLVASVVSTLVGAALLIAQP